MQDLVILDAVAQMPAFSEPGSALGRGERATLLSFSPEERITAQLQAELAQRYREVTVLSAAGRLDAVAPHVRQEYSRLVAEAPERIRVGRKSLREAYVFEGRLSLWWLNEIFVKRSDVYPAFARLCQLEVVRSLVAEGDVAACAIVTDDPRFRELMAAYCAQAGLRLDGPRPLARSGGSAPLHALASSLAWLARTAAQTLIAKAVSWGRTSAGAGDEPLIAFHTYYNTFWPQTAGERDMKFGPSLEVLREFEGAQAVAACTLAVDGIHPSVGVRDHLRLSWRLRRGRGLPLPIAPLDAFLTFRDLARAAAWITLVWKYYRLERSGSFRSHWRYHGVPFDSFMRDELRDSALRTPRYLAHALRVRRFVRQTRPSVFVYHMFELGLGRAITYGVRTAGTGTIPVGAQEGPIARGRLVTTHHPGEIAAGRPEAPEEFVHNPLLPAYLLLEGKGAEVNLLEAGYPPESMRVAGAPRLSLLTGASPRSGGQSGDRAAGEHVVLAVMGQFDGEDTLKMCLDVLAARPDLRFLLKPHPRGRLRLARAEEMIAAAPESGRCTIESADVYSLLAAADVVVATSPSVGMEAAAIGYPVVCMYAPDRLNASPLLDAENPGVHFATGPADLAEALDRAIAQPPDPARAKELEEYLFQRLDGGAPERWARVLREIAEEHRPAARG